MRSLVSSPYPSGASKSRQSRRCRYTSAQECDNSCRLVQMGLEFLELLLRDDALSGGRGGHSFDDVRERQCGDEVDISEGRARKAVM